MYRLLRYFLLVGGLLSVCLAVEQPAEYVIVPKDRTDGKNIAKVEAFLKTIIPPDEIFSQRSEVRNIFHWWITSLNSSQLEAIKRHSDILAVEEKLSAHHTTLDTSANTRENLRDNPVGSQNFSALTKREALEIDIQRNAPEDLRQISIPKGKTHPEEYPDFIFQKQAGKNIYIYIIGLGMSRHPALRREMPPDRFLPTLLTERAKKLNRTEDTDDSRISHGTCVAIKAAGRKLGVAKHGFVVSIKMAEKTLAELLAAYNLIAKNAIDERRLGKSVVVNTLSSKNSSNPWSHNQQELEVAKAAIFLTQKGIPFISAVDNAARIKDPKTNEYRTSVDSCPNSWVQTGAQFTTVGNVDFKGNIHPTSQRGSLVSIYAQGTDIECLDKNGQKMTATGASLSAPIVAGHVATVMSDPPEVLKGLSGIRLVSGLKYWIENVAFWKRPSGYKVLWNGVPYKKISSMLSHGGDSDC